MLAEKMEDMFGVVKADFFDQMRCGFLFQVVFSPVSGCIKSILTLKYGHSFCAKAIMRHF
jgi:hypothetical protein